MSSAVNVKGLVVIAAFAVGKGEIRRAEVGSVKDDDFVVVEKLHVHGGDAD